ncbi:hypothetical protein Hanom_Chr00s000001g01593711 [Helianthus anomalus]
MRFIGQLGLIYRQLGGSANRRSGQLCLVGSRNEVESDLLLSKAEAIRLVKKDMFVVWTGKTYVGPFYGEPLHDFSKQR